MDVKNRLKNIQYMKKWEDFREHKEIVFGDYIKAKKKNI
jgi:hypothetical protein